MTLDHVSLHTIKGHFCSLLISNIFSYPLFLLSTLCFFFTTLKHSFTFLQREYTLFLFVYYFHKRRMFCDPSGCNSGLISPSILLPTDIYQCVTPPCFFTPFKPIMLTFGLFSNQYIGLSSFAVFIVYHKRLAFAIGILSKVHKIILCNMQNISILHI